MVWEIIILLLSLAIDLNVWMNMSLIKVIRLCMWVCVTEYVIESE